MSPAVLLAALPLAAAPPAASIATGHGSAALGYSSFCSAGACVAVAEAVEPCRGAPPIVFRAGERVRVRLGFVADGAELRAAGAKPVWLGAGRTFAWRPQRAGVVTLAVSAGADLSAAYTACLVRRPRPALARAVETALSGTLVLSPAFPVCRVGRPCTRPIAGATLEFSRDGAVAGRAVTDANGRYRIALAPATYAVALLGRKPGDPGRGFGPSTIVVPPAPAARLDFAYDAGIR